jgi:hypothetical protein
MADKPKHKNEKQEKSWLLLSSHLSVVSVINRESPLTTELAG